MAIINDKEKYTLEGWIGKKCDFDLLYKASRDGCSGQVFHTKCDYQGPTVTVVNNINNSVFGGYTVKNWDSTSGFINDDQAFLFRFRLDGQSNIKKFPILANANGGNAIYCDASYGPTFGGGHDILTYNYDAAFDGNQFQLNGYCYIGNTYDDQGEDAYTITNGHMQVKEIEVYKVKDAPQKRKIKTVTEPWRDEPNWEQKTMDQLKEQLIGYHPFSDLDIPAANILLIGQVGAGKSSFFNSVTSIFRGKISSRAPSGSAEHSITTKYRMYTVRHQGQCLNFRLCDTRGIEEDMGLDSQDVCYILDGNISDRYQFNPSIPISTEAAGFIEKPRLKDRIHCVVFVVDASTLDVMSDKVTHRLKESQRRMNQKGIPQIIFLTKLDKVCTEVDKDVSNMYRSSAVRAAVDKAADMFGLPRSHVLPAKNYEKEDDLNTNINILILKALKRMLDFADDYLEEEMDHLQCENLHEMNIKE